MLVRLMRRLTRTQKGATAVEYGLIAALVVLTMMAALINVADTTSGMWGNVSTKVQNAH